MTTAIDTNVLLDVLIRGSEHAGRSKAAILQARSTGNIIISEPVFAELAAWFKSEFEMESFLRDPAIELVPTGKAALRIAGERFRQYARRRTNSIECPQCGVPRTVSCESCGSVIRPRIHIASDFIIGAHASVHADKLLTRDRGFYRRHYPALKLV